MSLGKRSDVSFFSVICFFFFFFFSKFRKNLVIHAHELSYDAKLHKICIFLSNLKILLFVDISRFSSKIRKIQKYMRMNYHMTQKGINRS